MAHGGAPGRKPKHSRGRGRAQLRSVAGALALGHLGEVRHYLREKIGAHDVTGLTRFAMQHGLIS